MSRRGLVTRSLISAGFRLASMVPQSTLREVTARPERARVLRRYRLSPFAYLRREGDVMVLESPTADARVELYDPAVAALVAGLAYPASLLELINRCGGMPPEAVSMALELIDDAGMIEREDDPSAGPELCSRDAWEFHDLLFHARSRRGRTVAPFGGTYRLAGRMDPPPPVRPTPAGTAVPLARPDLTRLEADDLPLSRVVEARRSERVYGDRPLDARRLGEFLYRVARIRQEQEVELETPRGPMRMAMASRPYPSGGALYELEFYAVVAACEGVEPGLYYYEPRGHALVPIRTLTADVEGLLRVPRLSWKYESMAYSLVLKHVGVAFQNMYLAATAMGLAPCALGAGDSDLFARVTGLDYYAETSVGEFLLGSRRGD
jgi:nitroreductase